MPARLDDERPPRTIDGLKKEAKHWLKLLRAGDAAARARLERAIANAPAQPTLRDVQHAIAIEHGFLGWVALATHLGASQRADPDGAERANWFLEQACIDPILTSGPAAQASHRAAAMRILSRHPDVARANIHTAVVCGEVALVGEILAAHPEAASERGGPVRFRHISDRESQWTPLLHLCYGRAPTASASDNAVAIARALLDRGADPNAYFEAGSHPSRYTCLTGLVGGGEEATTPHPRAEELVRLLVDRGANPVDVQLTYNTLLSGEAFRWFDLLYERSLELGRDHEWTKPLWNPKLEVSVLDRLLRLAVEQNDAARIEWLVGRGARLDAFPSLSRAADADADVERPFTTACFALNKSRAVELLQQYPSFLKSHVTLFAAAAQNRADVVAFVLDLGVPIDVQDSSKRQALHIAVSHDAFDVVRMLIARGADTEARETNWNNTPLDHASYGNQTQMIELLTSYSRDVFAVVWAGNIARLRDLLRAEPELAKAADGKTTPLMWLPDDEGKAIEAATLLLANGADPSVVNENGRTAAQIAAKRGLDDVAALLRRA